MTRVSKGLEGRARKVCEKIFGKGPDPRGPSFYQVQDELVRFARREESRALRERESRAVEYLYKEGWHALSRRVAKAMRSTNTVKQGKGKCLCRMVGAGEARGKLTAFCPIHQDEAMK